MNILGGKMKLELNSGPFVPDVFLIHSEKPQSIQYIFRFDNLFGASVIKHEESPYSGWHDLWELAVLLFDPTYTDHYNLYYDSPITNDTLVNLTDEEVVENLNKIRMLKPYREPNPKEEISEEHWVSIRR